MALTQSELGCENSEALQEDRKWFHPHVSTHASYAYFVCLGQCIHCPWIAIGYQFTAYCTYGLWNQTVAVHVCDERPFIRLLLPVVYCGCGNRRYTMEEREHIRPSEFTHKFNTPSRHFIKIRFISSCRNLYHYSLLDRSSSEELKTQRQHDIPGFPTATPLI